MLLLHWLSLMLSRVDVNDNLSTKLVMLLGPDTEMSQVMADADLKVWWMQMHSLHASSQVPHHGLAATLLATPCAHA